MKNLLFSTQNALKRMTTGGRIVNLSSVLSSRVLEFEGKQWAVELGPRGIVVNAVAPGPVDTDMNASWLRTDKGQATMIAARRAVPGFQEHTMNAQTSKVALVTGGSRGIGRATSYELARLGYMVAVHYRADAAAAEQTLAGVRERGSDGFTLQADLFAKEGIEKLFSEFDRTLSQRHQPVSLDVLVNNAGVAEAGTLEETSAELFERQFALNVKAVFSTRFPPTPRQRRPSMRLRVKSASSRRHARGHRGSGRFSSQRCVTVDHGSGYRRERRISSLIQPGRASPADIRYVLRGPDAGSF